MENLRKQTIAEIAIIKELINDQTQPLLARIANLEKEVVLLGNELNKQSKANATAWEALHGTSINGNNEKAS